MPSGSSSNYSDSIAPFAAGQTPFALDYSGVDSLNDRTENRSAEEAGLGLAFNWVGRLIVILIVAASPWIALPTSGGEWKFTSLSQTAQFWILALAVSGMVVWWLSIAFGKRTAQLIPFLSFPVAAGLIFVGCQLIPLPKPVAEIIAPHQLELYGKYASPLVNELLADESAANPSVRITMDVDGTNKMFNLLTLALICLLLGCHFFKSKKAILLLPFVLVANGIAITMYGLTQIFGNSPTIYGIEKTIPFGPFVNKNNAAGYLLICLAGSLALSFAAFKTKFESGQRPRPIITKEYPVWKRASLALGLFLADLTATKVAALLTTTTIAIGILMTFSRGGILAMGIGLVFATIYFSLTQKSSALVLIVVSAVFSVAGILSFTELGDQLVDRLNTISQVDLVDDDVRLSHWSQTAPAIRDFAPLGSGVGSYLNVHRLYRIGHETTVFYFAENQFFQTLVEAGIPGTIFLIAALLILALSVRFISRQGQSPRTTALCFMGVFLIPSQIVAAIFDFGLFIPCNTIALAVAGGFLSGQTHVLADRLKKSTTYRFRIAQPAVLAVLLLTFVAASVALISGYRYSRIESALGNNPYSVDFTNQQLQETDRRIEELKSSMKSQQDASGLTRLAELYIYRYRIRLFDTLLGNQYISDDLEKEAMERKWNSTRLDQLHGLVYQAWSWRDKNELQKLISDPLVAENLYPAIYYLKLARRRSPLQPNIHLLLAQLHSVAPKRDSDQFHLARSLELAPANATVAFICGILDLQANRIDSACVNLKKCLQIDGSNYTRVVQLTARTLPADQIAGEILPDDPMMLYQFAKSYMTTIAAQPAKFELFERALGLLNEQNDWNRSYWQTKVDVLEQLGRIEEAIETQRTACDQNPSTLSYKRKLVRMLRKNYPDVSVDVRRARLGNAVKIARDLALIDKSYKSLLDRTKTIRNNFEKSLLERN